MTLEELINSGSVNMQLIDSMYVKYQTDPWSLHPNWRAVFDQLETTYRSPDMAIISEHDATEDTSVSPDLRVYHLIEAYRTYGHLMAKVNPIALSPPKEPWQLQLKTLGFTNDDLKKQFPTDGLLSKATSTLEEIIAALKQTYCENIGVEYMAIQDPQLAKWLQKRIEPEKFKVELTIEQKKMILQHLNKSELFEVFLHTKYVGQKRFSLEGGETLIPILAGIIETGADLGLREFVLGMAHRGRLNVLSNIMDKSYAQIFSEFEEGYIPISFEGSGDVKYHKGFTSSLTTEKGHKIEVALTPNPSHLESVDPVVQGKVRAKQDHTSDEKHEHVLPILIHGDAAIAGQGVVYETMQMYQLEGYSTGGTIHIVINNQIGFTTLPRDGRSTRYCTDIARTFNAPVFHVDAEDPEACLYATTLAIKMRQRFHCDVFIDLNCYRKYGHNEGDEPAFTQPLEYQKIRKKQSIREIYRDHLINQGVLEKQMAEALEKEFKNALQQALSGTRTPEKSQKLEPPQINQFDKQKDMFHPFETGVQASELLKMAKRFCHIPEDFTIHKKLGKLVDERLEMAEGNRPIDWGMAETLAYASLLLEGISVRLSGQDSCRGTFSHRHAMWMDQEKERVYYPLKHLGKGQGQFDLYNSLLSEYAVLGFEFGYSIGSPETLVLWEAQFGDFCNGAQVIIDQYIATSEMKWGQTSGIVLLLPHGYEGQGPEHSSARVERFLTLCGNFNMQVVNPTQPAQLFHLLRRHMLKPMNKPLIIFTPKMLLRHPECVSGLDDFTTGSFQEVLDDPEPPENPLTLVFCMGKIFYEIMQERKKRGRKDLAIVRIEQLYPFHEELVKKFIAKYKGVKNTCWVQEEPENMGAWNFVRPRLRRLMNGGKIVYIGRKKSASPAVGSYELHTREHAEIIESLFGAKKK